MSLLQHLELWNPLHSQVKQQFEKVKSIPRENLLVPNTKQSKKVFPLVLDYNPSLPGIRKILHSHRHLIANTPSSAKIFPKGSIIPSFRRAKNIKEILARPRRTNHTEIRGCFKYKGKCNPCKNILVESDHFSSTRGGCRWCARTTPSPPLPEMKPSSSYNVFAFNIFYLTVSDVIS